MLESSVSPCLPRRSWAGTLNLREGFETSSNNTPTIGTVAGIITIQDSNGLNYDGMNHIKKSLCCTGGGNKHLLVGQPIGKRKLAAMNGFVS